MNIYEHLNYPSQEDWDRFYQQKKESLDKIHLSDERTIYNGFDFQGIEFSYWLQEFNNKTFDLINNYVILMFFYNKGIPDEEWYRPGEGGQSVQYFPHFTDKDFINLYWFGFYMESYYTRFSAVLDAVYHLINIKFNLGVKPKPGFRKVVLQNLKEKGNSSLYYYLKTIPKNSTYKEISDFRNNIAHNYRANQVDSGIGERKNQDGSVSYFVTVGNYTPSTKFIENIDKSIDFLASFVEEVRDKIIGNY